MMVPIDAVAETVAISDMFVINDANDAVDPANVSFKPSVVNPVVSPTTAALSNKSRVVVPLVMVVVPMARTFGPVAPVGPFDPVGPATPVGPVGPVAPRLPTTRAINSTMSPEEQAVANTTSVPLAAV